MINSLEKKFKKRENSFFKILILILTGIIAFGAIILPISSRPTAFELSVGSVATQDFQAPRNLTYTSDYLTEQKLTTIKNSVTPVYLNIDPAISRQQIDRLRKSIDFITLVRNDSYSDLNQKINDISNLTHTQISREVATQLINLDEQTWVSIQREAILVLEQVFRATIRDYQVQEAKQRVPTLISFSFSEDNSKIIENLVSPFVVPNSLFSKELTDEAINLAIEQVEPVEKSYSPGEIIIRRGQIIEEQTYEALEKFNFISPDNKQQEYFATGIFILLQMFFLGLYFSKQRSNSFSVKEILIISIAFIIFLLSAKFLIPNRTVLPYIFPFAGFTFAIGTLFGFEAAFVLSLSLGSIISFGAFDFQSLLPFYLIPSLCGSLILGQGRRISVFFSAGFVTGILSAGVILAIRLLDGSTDLIGMITLSGASLFNGMASASLGLLMQFFVAQILGITTAIQLLEISRPDHPLLQFILTNAPGSYQHSLQVANLAEQAAKDIGADQLLTRVGALYHDAGKAANPSFFIENQIASDLNSHDDLDPYISAATIIQHIPDGVELSKKYRLPSRITDFVREHHGTLMTKYFYVKAIEANNNNADLVDVNDFRYPGPIPQSKETAMLMLADGVEARARADKPTNREELEKIIHGVIDFCLKEGQLEDTDLTMKDLNIIVTSFSNTLINTYHPRIKYPELKTQPVELLNEPDKS
ncbi:MAG: HDIG domain-containing protein [Anaerolineaceae bacterium]|nr:HDIG domain-containing protein [Anaerolineaceae bacterium]